MKIDKSILKNKKNYTLIKTLLENEEILKDYKLINYRESSSGTKMNSHIAISVENIEIKNLSLIHSLFREKLPKKDILRKEILNNEIPKNILLERKEYNTELLKKNYEKEYNKIINILKRKNLKIILENEISKINDSVTLCEKCLVKNILEDKNKYNEFFCYACGENIDEYSLFKEDRVLLFDEEWGN